MTKAEAVLLEQLTEIDKVALTLWGEVRGESEPAMIAVASAISNRVKESGLQPTEIVMRPAQFSCWSSDPRTTNDEAVMRQAEALIYHDAVDSRMRMCYYLAEAIVAGTLRDTVRGATHYYAPKAMKPVGRVPVWARGLKAVAVAGGHLFFNDVAWYGKPKKMAQEAGQETGGDREGDSKG